MSKESFIKKINYGERANPYDLGEVADIGELSPEEKRKLLEQTKDRNKKRPAKGILSLKSAKTKV